MQHVIYWTLIQNDREPTHSERISALRHALQIGFFAKISHV